MSKTSTGFNFGSVKGLKLALDVPDETLPREFADVILIVEGRKLFANRTVLALASPVWRKMFSSDFKEKNETEIPLPGKKFEDMHELFQCITPSVRKPVNGKTTS